MSNHPILKHESNNDIKQDMFILTLVLVLFSTGIQASLDPYADLRFTFNPDKQLTEAELRSIKDPVIRCRASNPDELRDVRRKARRGEPAVWVKDTQTNAEFVAKRMSQWNVNSKAFQQRERLSRDERQRQTGIRQILGRTATATSRRRSARQGSPSDPMPFHPTKNFVGRPQTKAEWLDNHRARRRMCKKRSKQQKQMQLSDVRETAGSFVLPDLNLPASASE